MSTPIYHEPIVHLRIYALDLNWFQKLFFPTKLLNALQQYSPEEPHHTKAFKIYFALSQSNSILDWIGKLFLSQYRQFSQDILTKTILDLDPLTEKKFIEQIDKEEKLYTLLTPTSTKTPGIPASPKHQHLNVPPSKMIILPTASPMSPAVKALLPQFKSIHQPSSSPYSSPPKDKAIVPMSHTSPQLPIPTPKTNVQRLPASASSPLNDAHEFKPFAIASSDTGRGTPDQPLPKLPTSPSNSGSSVTSRRENTDLSVPQHHTSLLHQSPIPAPPPKEQQMPAQIPKETAGRCCC